MFLKKVMVLTITMPSLTQNLGPWLKKSHSKYSKKLSQEKDLMCAQSISCKNMIIFAKLASQFSNWLPFHWRL